MRKPTRASACAVVSVLCRRAATSLKKPTQPSLAQLWPSRVFGQNRCGGYVGSGMRVQTPGICAERSGKSAGSGQSLFQNKNLYFSPRE